MSQVSEADSTALPEPSGLQPTIRSVSCDQVFTSPSCLPTLGCSQVFEGPIQSQFQGLSTRLPIAGVFSLRSTVNCDLPEQGPLKATLDGIRFPTHSHMALFSHFNIVASEHPSCLSVCFYRRRLTYVFPIVHFYCCFL